MSKQIKKLLFYIIASFLSGDLHHHISVVISLLLLLSPLIVSHILCWKQLLSHTTRVLEFLLQQSEKSFDGGIQLHERNRKILRCLLSWVSSFWKLPQCVFPRDWIINAYYCTLLMKCITSTLYHIEESSIGLGLNNILVNCWHEYRD